jgi:hypothetical protein
MMDDTMNTAYLMAAPEQASTNDTNDFQSLAHATSPIEMGVLVRLLITTALFVL